jgi:hypothetical protein
LQMTMKLVPIANIVKLETSSVCMTMGSGSSAVGTVNCTDINGVGLHGQLHSAGDSGGSSSMTLTSTLFKKGRF